MIDQSPPEPETPGATPPNESQPAPMVTTTNTQKPRPLVREIVETLLLALLIFVLVRMVVLNFRVDGHSMESSLHHNEMLLVNRNAYLSIDQDKWFGWMPFVDTGDGDIWYPFGTPERGDIVVLEPPDAANSDKPYIKRVIGLPGDTIEIHDEGVYINGVRLDEPYIDEGNGTQCLPSMDFCSANAIVEISVGYVFVMGDNRTHSSDSREFGLVPVDNIIGKAWVTYWPVGDIGTVPHYDYPELEESVS